MEGMSLSKKSISYSQSEELTTWVTLPFMLIANVFLQKMFGKFMLAALVDMTFCCNDFTEPRLAVGGVYMSIDRPDRVTFKLRLNLPPPVAGVSDLRELGEFKSLGLAEDSDTLETLLMMLVDDSVRVKAGEDVIEEGGDMGPEGIPTSSESEKFDIGLFNPLPADKGERESSASPATEPLTESAGCPDIMR